MKHCLVFRVYKKVREERKWQTEENVVCCFRSAVCLQNTESDALIKKLMNSWMQLKKQDRVTGRFCRWDRPAMAILRISHFLHLQEIHILSAWKN